MARVISILYWLAAALIAFAMFPIALVVWALTLPFDRRKVVLHALTNVWGSLYTWINPLWSVQVEGREHIDGRAPYMMVSNHLSLVDIFVVHRLFCHYKWVSKIEIFRMPLIGWNMRLAGYIPLRRGDRHSVVEMLDRCRVALERGSSVMMFPEGTRSRTGQLKEFKPGAFELARDVAVAVLPMVIQGTATALPKKGLTVSRARMRVTVLPPIPKAEVEASTVEQLRDRARGQIAAFVEANPWPVEP
ncbi:MAG: 1-acylglycerol-3-phosphate O-acyltransferase [Deltaproteobacteria bacterium]|nr:1-acylglycerol-3-phosphate O-acyltransferase [Deltaproteobacteria bacterium]